MVRTVSIILPTYNRTRFLRHAVESVFAQTLTDWELIVADDGSDEETKAYLRALERPNVRVVWLAHCGNPSRVRNAALNVAAGKYVAFLDSDDVWAPTKLAAQVGALDSNERHRWSYTACNRIDADGSVLPKRLTVAPTPRSGWIFESLLALDVSAAMPTVVAKRSLLEEIGGFDEEQQYGEFHDLCLRLALRSEVIAIADELCSVRAHDEQYSADRIEAKRAWMRLYEKFGLLAPSGAARACCERMRARIALELAALQGANQDIRSVLQTLNAGKVLSWRRPGFWYPWSIAVLRPFVPATWRAARLRLLRGRRARV
jgi:glycosyltransferase involved in cell wall biosynthesis